MSIEESLNRLAAATEKLCAVQEQIFAAVTGTRPTPTATDSPAPSGPKPSRGKSSSAPAAPASAPSSPSAAPAAASGSPSTPSPAPAAAPAADGAGIKYDTVREAVIKLAEVKGHQVAVGVLAKFGAKNGKDVKPAEWPKLLQEVEAAAGVTIAQLTGKEAAPIA